MKKAMWIISIISIILTAVALQFMPDSVPMHYNAAGEIDRWGSKYENYIFPILIIVLHDCLHNCRYVRYSNLFI